jgi:general secretion pathway protein L
MSTSPSLASRLDSFGRSASELFTWWVSELADLLPAQLRAKFHLAPEWVELRLLDAAIELNLVTADGRRTLNTFPQDGSDNSLATETLGAMRGNERRLLLRLPGHSVLVRELSLPAAVEENLGQVMRYELDRYTPFKADAVYHGYRITGRDQGQVQVRLVVVPRETLDDRLHELQALGLYPDRIEADRTPGVDLAPAVQKTASRRRTISWRGMAVTLSLVLLIVAALLPLWKMREVAIFLDQELGKVQQTASQAQTLRAERDSLLAQSRFIGEQRARPATAGVLDELAEILPDDTWVQSLKYAGGRLEIRGFSGSASGLIPLIEASPLFESVSFVAPVNHNAQTDKDIFQIAFTVETQLQ